MGFLQDITGATARRHQRNAKAASDRELQAGFDEAQPFYEEAFDLYEPYAESGGMAQDRVNKLLGLGTAGERESAQQVYLDDPIFAKNLERDSNRLLKQLNARGQTYGGKAALAGGRVALENYGNYLDRLTGEAGKGFAATGAQSGIRSGQGDLRYGFGATKAGHETNYGNARAQGSTTGVNNLLNIAGTAAKIATLSDIRLKRDIKHVGNLPSGLNVYDFKYLWDDTPYRGVMAQEASEVFPESISYTADGFAMVDYSRIS